jgi:hypothetical protein
LERWDGEVSTGLVWLRIGASGGLVLNALMTLGFHKMQGGSRVAAQLVASRIMLSSIELVMWKLLMYFEAE